MTTWKDGGNCGKIYREIINEDDCVVAKVRIKRSAPYRPALNPTRPWPEGEANFALILQAPRILEALEAIRDRADDMMEIRDGSVKWTDWQPIRSAANAAIAAVKGKDEETNT